MTMTTPNQILVYLAECPSTESAVASRVGIPVLVARAMLQRLQKEGHSTCQPAGELELWKLTPQGTELAIALKNNSTPTPQSHAIQDRNTANTGS